MVFCHYFSIYIQRCCMWNPTLFDSFARAFNFLVNLHKKQRNGPCWKRFCFCFCGFSVLVSRALSDILNRMRQWSSQCFLHFCLVQTLNLVRLDFEVLWQDGGCTEHFFIPHTTCLVQPLTRCYISLFFSERRETLLLKELQN